MARASMREAVLIAVALVAASSAALAQHGGHVGQSEQGGQTSREPDRSGMANAGRIEGRFVSQTEDSITIEAAQNGQRVRLIYSVSQSTEFRGGVRVGAQVAVTYLEQGGTQIATRVEGRRRRGRC